MKTRASVNLLGDVFGEMNAYGSAVQVADGLVVRRKVAGCFDLTKDLRLELSFRRVNGGTSSDHWECRIRHGDCNVVEQERLEGEGKDFEYDL
jgi:hypothetical protein